MGRPYHGNIMDNRAACERVRNHGFSISEERWVDQPTRRDVVMLAVFNDKRSVEPYPLTTKRFSEYDEDVMLNEQTAWLNKLADELDYWQSKS